MATFWTRIRVYLHTTEANAADRVTSSTFLTGTDAIPAEPANATPAYGTGTNVPLRL